MINYEAEVKRVYTDAKVHVVGDGSCIISVQYANETNRIVVGDTWQSAYENLKKQGKI
jgi:hypothetical protein